MDEFLLVTAESRAERNKRVRPLQRSKQVPDQYQTMQPRNTVSSDSTSSSSVSSSTQQPTAPQYRPQTLPFDQALDLVGNVSEFEEHTLRVFNALVLYPTDTITTPITHDNPLSSLRHADNVLPFQYSASNLQRPCVVFYVSQTNDADVFHCTLSLHKVCLTFEGRGAVRYDDVRPEPHYVSPKYVPPSSPCRATFSFPRSTRPTQSMISSIIKHANEYHPDSYSAAVAIGTRATASTTVAESFFPINQPTLTTHPHNDHASDWGAGDDFEFSGSDDDDDPHRDSLPNRDPSFHPSSGWLTTLLSARSLSLHPLGVSPAPLALSDLRLLLSSDADTVSSAAEQLALLKVTLEELHHLEIFIATGFPEKKVYAAMQTYARHCIVRAASTLTMTSTSMTAQPHFTPPSFTRVQALISPYLRLVDFAPAKSRAVVVPIRSKPRSFPNPSSISPAPSSSTRSSTFRSTSRSTTSTRSSTCLPAPTPQIPLSRLADLVQLESLNLYSGGLMGVLCTLLSSTTTFETLLSLHQSFVTSLSLPLDSSFCFSTAASGLWFSLAYFRLAASRGLTPSSSIDLVDSDVLLMPLIGYCDKTPLSSLRLGKSAHPFLIRLAPPPGSNPRINDFRLVAMIGDAAPTPTHLIPNQKEVVSRLRRHYFVDQIQHILNPMTPVAASGVLIPPNVTRRDQHVVVFPRIMTIAADNPENHQVAAVVDGKGRGKYPCVGCMVPGGPSLCLDHDDLDQMEHLLDSRLVHLDTGGAIDDLIPRDWPTTDAPLSPVLHSSTASSSSGMNLSNNILRQQTRRLLFVFNDLMPFQPRLYDSMTCSKEELSAFALHECVPFLQNPLFVDLYLSLLSADALHTLDLGVGAYIANFVIAAIGNSAFKRARRTGRSLRACVSAREKGISTFGDAFRIVAAQSTGGTRVQMMAASLLKSQKLLKGSEMRSIHNLLQIVVNDEALATCISTKTMSFLSSLCSDYYSFRELVSLASTSLPLVMVYEMQRLAVRLLGSLQSMTDQVSSWRASSSGLTQELLNTLPQSYATIKSHYLLHFAPAVVLYGSLSACNTELGERAQCTFVKRPWSKSSNRRAGGYHSSHASDNPVVVPLSPVWERMLGVIAEQEIGAHRSIDWSARLDTWMASAGTRYGPIPTDTPLPHRLLRDLGEFISNSLNDDTVDCESDDLSNDNGNDSSPVGSSFTPAVRPTSLPRRHRVADWKGRVQKLYSTGNTRSLLYLFATMACPIAMVTSLMTTLSPRLEKALALLDARTLLYCCDAIESATMLRRAVVAFATYSARYSSNNATDVLFPEPFRAGKQLYAIVKQKINQNRCFLKGRISVPATVRRSAWICGTPGHGRGHRIFADQLVAFGVEASSDTLFSTGGQVGRQDVIVWMRKQTSRQRFGIVLATLVVDLVDENEEPVPVVGLIVERLFLGEYPTLFRGHKPVYHNHYDPRIQVLLIGQTAHAANHFPPPFSLSPVDLVPDRTLATAASREEIIENTTSPSFFSFYMAKILINQP